MASLLRKSQLPNSGPLGAPTCKQDNGITVVGDLGESGNTGITSIGSNSGKSRSRTSRYARLLSAIQAARQVDKNTSTTKVQDSEILHVSTAEASSAPSAFEACDTSASPQAFVVENNNDVPVSRHSQLAKRMWATRREQVLGAIQEEQAALISDPIRAESARLYAEKVEASMISPWEEASRVYMTEDLNDIPQRDRSRELYAGEFRNANDGQRALSPLAVSTPVLFDPGVITYEMDRQLPILLDEVRIASRHAQLGYLRPYDDPMDGAAIGAYLKERSTYRIDVYQDVFQQLITALHYAWPAVVERLRRHCTSAYACQRAQRRLLTMKQHIIHSKAETDIVRNALAHGTSLSGIITRNLLYADERGMSTNIKTTAHAVNDGWLDIRDLCAQKYSWRDKWYAVISGSQVFKRTWEFREDVKKVRSMLKGLRYLQEHTEAAVVTEMRQAKQLTHEYYKHYRAVQLALKDLRTFYYQAGNRDGLDYRHKYKRAMELDFQFRLSESPRSIMTLMRCIDIIHAARISKKYKHQRWSRSTPRPVLPDFVQEAVKKHRQNYGPESIF